MFPILLISNTPESSEKYIKNFIVENDFDMSYINRIVPVKKELAIVQIRALKKEIMISSPKRRLYVIEALDVSGVEVQNSLLKTLEEKTEFIQFLFPIRQIWNVLPTIVSRCKIVQLAKNKDMQVSENTKKLIQKIIADKSMAFLSEDTIIGKDREEVALLLNELIIYFRPELASGNKAVPSILKTLLTNRALLLNNNLNPQLTLDTTLFYIRNSHKNI